ncbi:MAG: sensor domain-containing diguanylate cyclase [Bacillaceae bacterium]|nr:sensor domain-containing diguanylate cyclase [Bacillaceae bacterium]
MEIQQAIIPFLVYVIPAFFLFYMSVDILSRNFRGVEHRLVSLMIFCYFLLLVEEYIRHTLPIEYSSILADKWFSSIGVIIPSLGFHFIGKITHLNKKMPRYVYPYVFYIPLPFILLNFLTENAMFSSQEFVQTGIWKVPVFNGAYYSMVTMGNIVILLYMVILALSFKTVRTKEMKKLYQTLLYTMTLMLLWTSIFGYFSFGSLLPPHPFIYAGIIWSVALKLSMNRYNFLTDFKSRYKKLFNLNPLSILLINETGRIIDVNPGAKKLLKIQEINQMNFHELIHPDMRVTWSEAFDDRIRDQMKINEYETSIMINDEKMDVVIEGDYIVVDDEPHYILILRDITSDIQKSERISFLAYHDHLTGLPNRRHFYKRFRERIQDWKKYREESMLALILIDLDYFKRVNDQYGHYVGDQFLKHVAGVLKSAIEGRGLVARLGGDEFVMFLENVHSSDSVKKFMTKLFHAVKMNPFVSDHIHIPIDMSVGVSFCPIHGETCDDLLRYADHSMYNIKNSTRNSYEIYEKDQNAT